MMPLMKTSSFLRTLIVCAILPALALAPASAEKKKDQIVKPLAGPRATSLRVARLYVQPDTASQTVDRVQIGRELVVAERSAKWVRVYANTDIQELHDDRDTPWVGSDDVPPPVSGWMEARGIVIEDMPNGDQIIMGEAANEESLASDPRGPANAARSARFLYRRVVEMFPNSPLAPEAAWRAADIQWQIQKAEASSRPSAKEQAAYLRDTMDEDEMKKVIKTWPHTRQADLAAYDLLDNKMCGDWQGQTKCPEKESEIYEKYATEHPDGPRTAQAFYQAIYRQCALVDMFKADNEDKKADAAKARAHDLLGRLQGKFAQSDYAPRAAAMVFKIDQGIAVYGIDRQD